MNRQKAQEAINKITEENKSRNARAYGNQYPASKAQIAKLTELGLIDMMPVVNHKAGIGYTNAALVIEASEVQTVGAGEDVETFRSDLYKALHEEETPEPVDDGEFYIVRDELDDLIDEVSEMQWREQLEADAAVQEAEEAAALKAEKARWSRLDSVMTSGEVASTYGIADATVRQTIARGAIQARKSGSVWLILRSDAERFWNRNAVKGVTTWLVTVLTVLAIVSQL